MRVTSNTFPNRLIEQITRLTNRTNQYQTQAATGQRIALPEDDPAAMRRVLDMQGQTKKIAQYTRNIERHQELAQASYASMSASKKIVDRAGEIATLAGGINSPEQLKTLAVEVDQLVARAVQVANTKNRNDYLFGGTKSDTVPFVANKDAQGKTISVSYQGNTELAESEVAEQVTLSAQTLGANTTGSGNRGLYVDSQSGADIFSHLIALRDNLQSGNAAQIRSVDRGNIQKDEENFLFHYGTNGVTQSRLETSMSVAKQRLESLDQLVSRETDVDLAAVIVKLTETQNAYKAALQSGGTILNQSLLDYIR